MSIITRMLRQTAVYWGLVETDRFGQPIFDDPIEISVRWEDKLHSVGNTQGELQESEGKVYVDRDVLIDSYLMLGELTSDIAGDPRELEKAYRIKAFEMLPNFRATQTLRTVLLDFQKGNIQ